MKIGSLLKFRSTGKIGTIVDISKDFGGYAVIYIHEMTHYKNPTHMSLAMIRRCAEVIA